MVNDLDASMAPHKRGPYAKSAATRARIVEAAEQLFAHTGFRATTFKEIAERAEISERGLQHHFASKVDLLVAVLESHEGRMSERIPATGPMAIFTALVAQERALAAQSHLAEVKTILTAEAIAPDHPAHVHYARNYELLRQFLIGAFDQLRAEGELAVSTPSDVLAATFIALTDGTQLQRLYDPKAPSPDTVLGTFMRYVVPNLPVLEDHPPTP